MGWWPGSGTQGRHLAYGLIVGFAAAVQLALQDREQRHQRLKALRDQLWADLQRKIPGVRLNGALAPRLAHNLNISLPGVNGNRLHRALRPHLACSSGSACGNGTPPRPASTWSLAHRSRSLPAAESGP